MVSSGASAQRARTKTPDFSELFRSGSRHGSNPSLVSSPSPGEKSTVTKPRRSMLPFLGRKKPAEQTAGTSTPLPPSRKSHGALPANPVNTVRRSFGNGHTVLMITPSPSTVSVPAVPAVPTEVLLSNKLPSMDVPTSLGSKLAAHFIPLRSPSKATKAHKSLARKSAPASPPVLSPATLSPPVPDIRAPSIESQHSTIQSRSTTPRPLRTFQPSPAEDGDEEDFSDLFTLPNQIHGTEQYRKGASALSVNAANCESPTEKGEAIVVDPITPPGPCLQFPIPPSTIGRPPLRLSSNSSLRSSVDLISLSSQRSKSPSKAASPKAPGTPHIFVDGGSDRAALSDFRSQDERHGSRHRVKSLSGSETDASRNYDSSYSSSASARLRLFPKPPSLKPFASGSAKVSSGPPPSVPLPTPPLSPPPSAPGGSGLRSAPNTPPIRLPISPRPRANTLSVTSNLMAPGNSIAKSSPSRTSKESTILMPDATAEDLRDALVLQRRKNSQLQDYISTITKRYEDDRVTMTKTIEKLERNVRKKMREIEGLRWLVIHNGAVSDIDAAANLARSSLSTQEDGDLQERGDRTSRLSLAGLGALVQGSPSKDGSSDEPSSTQSTPSQKGLVITTKVSSSTLDVPSDAASSAASSQTSFSFQARTPSTPSVIHERFGVISRAERQKSKEERRATRALRRISASSTATGTNLTIPASLPPSSDNLINPSFNPKQSMEEVLEKLRPFGN